MTGSGRSSGSRADVTMLRRTGGAYDAAMTDDSDLTPTAASGPDEGLDEFRTLVREAFERAQSSGKPDWGEMTSAVLKNRLLSISEGEFSQDRYGSPSFIHLVRRVPDLLDIVNDNPPFRLRIKTPITEQADIDPAQESPTTPASEDTLTVREKGHGRRTRIRDDLWRAVMDYGSGNVYVFDPDTGLARPRISSDLTLPQIPTISRGEVESWRHEFIESLEPSVKTEFSDELEAWADGRGRQSDLPGPTRGPWAKFTQGNVIQILLTWFRGQGISPPSDMVFATESRNLPSSEAIGEVVQTRRLRELIIRAVREMTYEELSQVPLPASLVLRISGRWPGQDD
jgi:hypothetical protein